VYLVHMLTRYMPHFIALSASSPFYQGEDTSFQSSRLTAVSAFPLSGHMPFVPDWSAFLEYFETMRGYGIVEGMKDFYWDIRPKPEFGTIEIRVCDTPLTVRRAAHLAGYAQALAAWLLEERSRAPTLAVYQVNAFNRFEACRFGCEGKMGAPPPDRCRMWCVKPARSGRGRPPRPSVPPAGPAARPASAWSAPGSGWSSAPR